PSPYRQVGTVLASRGHTGGVSCTGRGPASFPGPVPPNERATLLALSRSPLASSRSPHPHPDLQHISCYDLVRSPTAWLARRARPIGLARRASRVSRDGLLR